MSKGFGIHGSTTSHGGTVMSTQSRSSQMGNLFLRAGDGFACPKCKTWSTLIKSNDHVIFDGKAVAYVGDQFTCGASLMPKQVHVVGDVGGGSSVSSARSNSQPSSSKQNSSSSLVADKKKEPCPPECIVETVSFNSTPGPYVISMEMWKKILEYEKFESKPYQPGDNTSGVTLAIGYDLGQQSAAQIKADLARFYTESQIARLLKAQGKKGAAAKALVPQLLDITITKEKGLHLATVLKTRYANQTLSIYPGALKLHPHCQGVLLSLVFNRGPALSDPKSGLTRKHMRQIKEALDTNSPDKVPDILRDMSKLWNKKGPQGNSGVGKRRRDEADIFEKGLKCDCYE